MKTTSDFFRYQAEEYQRARMTEPDWLGGIEPLQREILRLRALLAERRVIRDYGEQ